MAFPFALIALAAHLAVLVRVLTYRRNGARHRRHASWFAWMLVAVAGGASIEWLLHTGAVGFFDAATAVFLAMFVCGTRGNVARLLRSE
ncbi:phage holin family protein [Burkholderia cenocepacia]|uniref:phage holin family protein n=1 Tax=Burkholderia cenocepacia TaxID=95486 RepID=UPI001B9CA554|nr:phage holin family protein [Burkholderia cenocepacia]MBR8100555.1 phage holin family protein [Burkholderia cenocepacia]MCW5137111.1 phage holin family protein [Burkholderia cenocepacia]MDI9648753.1 phage holin family protein [Burkholderia cenocepacia]MDI9686121.1 phage holin family protein [Burkholderia cenocepacia]MDN7683431.1 phage holin family protein [Burkholderia cenocepacia]